MKKKKILELSLQHFDDVKKAVEFNAENNYEYVIIDTNNLIKYDSLAYLLRCNYELNIYADYVELRHKNYDNESEKIKGVE